MDARTGDLLVLEVNAQCGCRGENITSIGAVIRFAGTTYAAVVQAILHEALRHAEAQVRLARDMHMPRVKIASCSPTISVGHRLRELRPVAQPRGDPRAARGASCRDQKLTTFRQLRDLSKQGFDLYVNLIEGYSRLGHPVDRCRPLARPAGAPYTGPNAELYDPPKVLMKYIAHISGVKTSPTWW
jgi:hypothetical protein